MKYTHRKKNKFLTFICSCIPGAAEMYMGFMKSGLSLLTIFMLGITLCWALGEIALITLPVIWIYGFFHAWNVEGLEDEDFTDREDVYIWEEFLTDREHAIPGDRIMKYFPILLIFMGFAVIWSSISAFLVNLIPEGYWDIFYPLVERFPRNVMAVLCIIFAIRLIKSKKKQMESENAEASEAEEVTGTAETVEAAEAAEAAEEAS